MSKIQINDVKLDGAELFNDSETFLDELQDSEMEQIVGGLRVAEEDYAARIYPHQPIDFPCPTHPRKPIHPRKPFHPKEPIHHPYPIDGKHPIALHCPITPVIL